MKGLKHVGLDVHAQSIAVAVCEGTEVMDLGVIPHDVSKVLKKLRKLGGPEVLQVVYEAGPTGYALCRRLHAEGYRCQVIAPTLVPEMAGDRVKTDRRDAAKLARLSAAGLLTPVYVPDASMEALRDLVRCRESSKSDELRARHRLSKFLLRHGRQKPKDIKKNWTLKHLTWLGQQKFEELAQELTFQDLLHQVEHQRSRVDYLDQKISELVERLPDSSRAVVNALQAMRGIALLTAVTVVTEVGDLSRFSHPTQLMAYAGLVPREHSSGTQIRRGAITKTGNAHLRRALGESAWAYRFAPRVSYELKVRQRSTSPHIQSLAWNAQRRLHYRYKHLLAAGKHQNKVMGAVARELLGFIWHIGIEAEKEYRSSVRQPKATR